MKKGIQFLIRLAAILLGNTIPLYGIVRLGWNIEMVVLAYWAETLVFVLVNPFKLFSHRGVKSGLTGSVLGLPLTGMWLLILIASFASFQYYFDHAEGLSLWSAIIETPTLLWQMRWVMLGFVVQQLMQKHPPQTEARILFQLFAPLRRVLLLHLLATVSVGLFADARWVQGMGLLLILLKTIPDIVELIYESRLVSSSKAMAEQAAKTPTEKQEQERFASEVHKLNHVLSAVVISMIGTVVLMTGIYTFWFGTVFAGNVGRVFPDDATEFGETFQDGGIPAGTQIFEYTTVVEKPTQLFHDPYNNLLIFDAAPEQLLAVMRHPSYASDAGGETDALIPILRKPAASAYAFRDTPPTLYTIEGNTIVSYMYRSPYLFPFLRLSRRQELAQIPDMDSLTEALILQFFEEDQQPRVLLVAHTQSGPHVFVLNLETNQWEAHTTNLAHIADAGVHPTTGDIWLFGANREDVDELQNEQHPSENILFSTSNAALSMTFIPVDGWGTEWQNDLLVGYKNTGADDTGRILRIDLNSTGTEMNKKEELVVWPQGGFVEGRPRDLLALPNGIVYVADDGDGKIYQFVVPQ